MTRPLDGLTVVLMLVIAAFAIDRIVAGVLFMWTLLRPQDDPALMERPRQIAMQKKLKLVYAISAAILAIAVVVMYPTVRILGAFGMQENLVLDGVLTCIVLMGGSDQLANLLKTTGMPEAKKFAAQAEPIQINGRLVLEESPKVMAQKVGKP